MKNASEVLALIKSILSGEVVLKDSNSGEDFHTMTVIGGVGPNVKVPKKPKDESVVVKFDATPAAAPIEVSHGLAMGFAIVCKKDGEDYYDVQNDHIPEESMLKASIDFMETSRVAKEMHAGDPQGAVVFAMPITDDIRKYIIENDCTGLFIGMKPSADVLAKFKSGEYTGFSIGGSRLEDEEVK